MEGLERRLVENNDIGLAIGQTNGCVASSLLTVRWLTGEFQLDSVVIKPKMIKRIVNGIDSKTFKVTALKKSYLRDY